MKKLIPFLFSLLFIFQWTAFAADEITSKSQLNEPGDYHQMNGKRIGTLTGSFFDQVILEKLPDAEIFYFDTTTDLLTALKSQKIDAMIFNEATIKYLKSHGEPLKILDGNVMEVDNAAIFPHNEKGRALETQYSEYLKKLWADGTITRLDEKWFSPDESQKTIIDYKNLPDTNGTLTLAVDPVMEPFCYIRDNLVTGYEIEIAAGFCEEYGYRLNIQTMSFASIIPAVVNGKADFASSSITITAERAESVLFSEPVYKDSYNFVVLSDSAAVVPDVQTDNAADTAAEGNSLPQNEDTSAAAQTEKSTTILDSIASSFEKTFIREERWKLFIQGIGITLLITVLSAIFGTILGFLLFLLCRNGNKFVNTIVTAFSWLIEGMPMVVLLMILFYIVFGKVSISGTIVAIIGFTLTVAVGIYGLIKMGVGTIDRGQYDAAYALGYPETKTFFRIILPQVIPLISSAYSSQIVSLIKATAIVGYIAVQDLTKMGDIVRSRTYEAFFPLIAVTIIYFLLEFLLGRIVVFIVGKVNLRRRDRNSILKGVDTHDQH